MSALGRSGDRSDSSDTTAAPLPTVGTTEDYQACLILKGMSLNLTPSELETTEGFLMFIAATKHLPPRGDTAILVKPAVEKYIPPVGKMASRLELMTPSQHCGQTSRPQNSSLPCMSGASTPTTTRPTRALGLRGRRDTSGLILASSLRRPRREETTWLAARKQILPFISRRQSGSGRRSRSKKQDLTPNPMLAIPMPITHAEPVRAPKKIARQKSKVSKAKPKAEPASNPASKLTPNPPYQVQADLPDAAQTRLSGSRGQCHATGAVGAARNDECVWIYSFTGAGATV